MANPHRGEVSFECSGKAYKMSFSTNALAELEDALKMNVNEIGKLMEPGKFSMANLKIVFWAGLQDHQPGMTMDDVSQILRHQVPHETTDLVSRAFAITFPPPDEGGDARPPEASKAGNGQASSPHGNQ